MIAKIRHLATHTEHYDKECKFYQTIFGMKQITTGLVDENGKSNPDRGHISDGVIGMALLAKRAGSQAGIDHFGFEVDDVGEAVNRLNRFYPDLLHTRALTYVPFAGTNHIALRARKPEEVAEFYTKVLELKGVEEAGEEGSITLTDGKVRLIIRRCHNGYYRSLRQGFDHIGFNVESVEKTKKDLDEIAAKHPECAPKKIGGGPQSGGLVKDMDACPIGQHAFADPDGILLDISE